MERRSRCPAGCLRSGAAACSTREQPRRLTHICARGDNEVVIVDLWESEEDLQRMMENPEFQRNLEAAGWPSEPIEQTFQVHATIP
jgi:quinol monooxygenase YgiN